MRSCGVITLIEIEHVHKLRSFLKKLLDNLCDVPPSDHVRSRIFLGAVRMPVSETHVRHAFPFSARILSPFLAVVLLAATAT